LEFQFSGSPEIGIPKKNPSGDFGIVNEIRIPPPMGVPEIGTKNWNSQPRSRVHCIISGSEGDLAYDLFDEENQCDFSSLLTIIKVCHQGQRG
jgi:hypothetical protein